MSSDRSKAMAKVNKLLILVPTLNEAKTVKPLLKELEKFRSESAQDFDLIVIDDASEDGTAQIVRELNYSWVKALDRARSGGLGAAYRAGFELALASGKYTHIVTMDADGSHRVADLAALISAIQPGKSLVLGSRWISGGSIINWPKYRQFLSKSGTGYAKFALGINLSDLTGGYRIYSVELLENLKLETMYATGYCFQIEMAMAADLAGATTVEVPITFIERVDGRSKMSRAIVLEALLQTTRWALTRRLRPNADNLHYVRKSETEIN